MGTTPGEHVEVTKWEDIDSVSSKVSEGEKELVKSVLNRSDEGVQVVWFPDFIAPEEKGLAPIQSGSQLVECRVEDYSDDAWSVQQGNQGDVEFLPKDWVIVFEKVTSDELENEQTSLTAPWGGA